MDKQALLSMLQDLAPPELFEGVEGAQNTMELLPLLDAELQRSSNRMQRIQEYRNKLSSPMYSLLPELLSKIFVIYATDQHELFNLRWTRLLLVCRRWYDIGVSTPKLWSYINLLEPTPTSYSVQGIQGTDVRLAKRLETQLARAGTSPLTVKTGLHGRNADISECMRPYQSVFWDASALASLSLSGDKKNVAGTLKDMAGKSHPILKDITIGYEGMRFTMGVGPLTPAPPPNTSISLPDSLLGDGSPKLTSISINGVTLNWALVRNLRLLHATFDDNAIPAPSLESIADALGHCPLLDDLRMMLPTAFLPNGAALSAIVPLRHLRKATIRGNSDVCAALFQAFAELPRSARISLISAASSNLQQITHLSSLLGTHGRVDGAPAIRAITLNQGSIFQGVAGTQFNFNVNIVNGELRSTQFCLTGRTFLDRQRHFDVPFALTPTGSTHMSISALPTTETTTELAIASVLQAWPLADATAVDLRSCRAVPVEQWRTLLDNMPSVTTVVLRPEAPSLTTLLELLNSALRDNGRRIVKNIILDTGELAYGSGMSTLFGGGGAVQESPTLRARLNLMRILQYCGEAAEAGVPLDTIELVNDDARAHIDRMMQIGAETDWAELYRDLSEGFVYDGVLRNASVGSEGVKKDSFVGSKATKVNDALHRYARRFLF